MLTKSISGRCWQFRELKDGNSFPPTLPRAYPGRWVRYSRPYSRCKTSSSTARSACNSAASLCRSLDALCEERTQLSGQALGGFGGLRAVLEEVWPLANETGARTGLWFVGFEQGNQGGSYEALITNYILTPDHKICMYCIIMLEKQRSSGICELKFGAGASMGP
ncbi:hypothetical protein JB92DRAFT_3064447 [Gautieria morchelliformis]|nr:hypothetical protein JB92DRAFT_3064447 [Gautieria morchelliformis]